MSSIRGIKPLCFTFTMQHPIVSALPWHRWHLNKYYHSGVRVVLGVIKKKEYSRTRTPTIRCHLELAAMLVHLISVERDVDYFFFRM